MTSATPIVSVRPVVVPAAGRGADLRVRVTAPTTGTDLPVVLFAHGFGKSMDDYAPLVEHWAAAGLVVLQPTFLDSRTLHVTPEDPRYADIWRIRVADLTRVLDSLALLEAAVPGLPGRVDHDRIAAVGHSWGGQSVGMLLGARVLDAAGVPGESLTDPRIRAGVLLATTGTGEELTPFAAEHFAFMRPDFSSLTTPSLVVAGDADQSALSTRGPDWFTDVFRLSPGATDLLTLAGGEHSLGGISGHGVTETTDESPERVALVQRATTAYLRTALGVDPAAWPAVRAEDAAPAGHIESR
ncbi:prolyl oligopeptidase family serine peptidase [Modestobacter muralis]|uniref:Prolyl oligopeptidase family serine peptidase n=1 Tax=Modestobacter muralis TaxID=1608614 RepID=A0A6P0ERX1_9ACTN|nr:prolyl oligopeptidase family serine peptidase [Modestobacter muralis]NEK93625.1 prolyl oligopeptidase family serine peptidase [Modestobacter muralis]NEN50392.1 prolyl oligopeptidase family serine peptidase [Modestobacter muralis]